MLDMLLYPLEGNFKVGDRVIDKTAVANSWPDVSGEVIEIDGSNIKVRYDGGNERWKMHISLRKA